MLTKQRIDMISVEISGDETRENDEITTEWLAKAFHARGLKTNLICVIVRIKHANVKLDLSTGACASTGGGKPIAQFNSDEQKLIHLWIEDGLDQNMFPFGKLVAFLKKLFKYFDLQLK